MKKFYLVLAILVQVSVVFSQTHFNPGFVGAGDNQMGINIVGADIGGVQLDAGDEVAVFDGNLCCGVVVLTQTIIPGDVDTYATIKAGMDDGDVNGFTPGNKMYFRFWDNSTSTEYHNIIPIVTDNGGQEITNAFAGNGTAFVNASTAVTTKTWVDWSSTGWGDPDAWDPAGVPDPTSNIVIPGGLSQYPNLIAGAVAYCGSLDINAGASILISSTPSGTGSMIVSSDISGSGVVNARRYLPANGWHMVSVQISGQTIEGLLLDSNIPSKDGNRGMIDYEEGTDVWNYFTDATTGSMSSGKGYGIRRSANGIFTFTGSLINSDVSVPVSSGGNGWNLVGNPYSSAIYARQEVFGFLTENASVIDPGYIAIYLWDPTANGGLGAYTIVNYDEGQSNIAQGQGFFIKAESPENVIFKQTMQVHQTDASFKSAIISTPNIVLKATSGEITSSTKVKFKKEMSLGLDPGFDAGIMRNGHGFDIYTRLVEDNGIDFAIQALPHNSANSYEIPVGVDATKGGEIVFSAETVDLPAGFKVVLEDRLTNSETDISNGELYVADLGAESNGVGRFYLKVGSSIQTGIDDIQKNDLSVYKIDNDLYIKGNVSNTAEFMVYSIDGRLMNRFGATSESLNRFNITGYTPGVYFVRVQDVNKYKPVKFVVER